VGAQQDRVDALEAEGRVFRGDFGRAIDELVRDRSRERARAEAASQHLKDLESTRAEDRPSEVSIWESAAMSAVSGDAAVAEQDLTFQIEALQRSLDGKNLALEQDLVEASGALEGSLTAIRHLTHELQRLLDEALGEIREAPLDRAAGESSGFRSGTAWRRT
jgi:hypothetical protein